MTTFVFSPETIALLSHISQECLGDMADNGRPRCSRCLKVCQMLTDFQVTPKVHFSKMLKTGEVEPELPFSCNLCSDCTCVCPKDLNLQHAFQLLRQDLAKAHQGRSPIKGHRGIEMHQRFGFSPVFNTACRARLAEGKRENTVRRVFVPGCSLPSYKPELVEAILHFLQEKLPDTATLLKCCGKPTMDMGQLELFERRYGEFQAELDSMEADEVITACQNCYKMIEAKSPRQKVVSLWSLLPRLGLPKESLNVGKESDLTFAIHDSCPTRHVSAIHDGVRWIMDQLGYTVSELEKSRENTTCCGMGGMVAAANFPLAEKVMKARADEALSRVMVVYCASCRTAMLLGGKRCVHLLDLIFGVIYTNSSVFENKQKGTLANWFNRFRAKRCIERAYIRENARGSQQKGDVQV